MDISDEIIRILRQAKHVVALTGAGISAESGIPTFREAKTGLWSKYNPEELATPQAFSANPELVWNWYRWRQEIINQTEPNPGHFALAQMESYLTEQESIFTLITQNVDGLHQQAGNQQVNELHGNIHRSKCVDCDKIAQDNKTFIGEIPRCALCGGLLRPDVVWFGESLPQEALQTAWSASEDCDVFFSIGTSALVQPAASLPILALQNGATVIEINPNPTQISNLAGFVLEGPSGYVLPQLVEKAWSVIG